jgi:hypothetical protein
LFGEKKSIDPEVPAIDPLFGERESTVEPHLAILCRPRPSCWLGKKP